MIVSWIAVYFVHEFGFRLSVAGIVGSTALMLGVLGRPAGGVLVMRLGLSPRGLIIATLATNVTGLILLAIPARPLAIAVLGVVLVGLGSSGKCQAPIGAGQRRIEVQGCRGGAVFSLVNLKGDRKVPLANDGGTPRTNEFNFQPP